MTPILSFAVLVALTIGLVEVAKLALKLPKNVCPALAVAIGLVLTIIGYETDLTSLSYLMGIVVGLSASGLFDQKKLLSLLK